MALDWRASCLVSCDLCLKNLLAKLSCADPDSSSSFFFFFSDSSFQNKNKTVAARAEQKGLEADLGLRCLLGTIGTLRLGGCRVIESEEPDMDGWLVKTHKRSAKGRS